MENLSVFGLLAVIFALAFLVETLVEVVFGKLFEKITAITLYSWTIMYLALAVGVIGAFIYQFDLLTILAQFVGVDLAHNWFGTLLTGLAIGRGANYLHEFVSKYFKKPEA